MAIIALREIQKNEEITFHYNFVPFDGFAAQKCECKSGKCKGIIAQKNNTKSKEQFLTSLNLKQVIQIVSLAVAANQVQKNSRGKYQKQKIRHKKL